MWKFRSTGSISIIDSHSHDHAGNGSLDMKYSHDVLMCDLLLFMKKVGYWNKLRLMMKNHIWTIYVKVSH